MSEKLSVREEIALVAGPREWGDTRDSWLARVSKRVPTVTFRTVRALWYGEIHDNDHWAARDIRRAAEIVKAKQEAAAHADHIRQSIERLRHQDQDFFSAEIDRLERAIGRLGTFDRA